jgi:hypothetical protein
MDLIPWSSIQNAHTSNGGKGLKEYIENWLTHLVETNHQKVQIVQEVLTPPPPTDDSVSLTVRVLSIKSILDASNAAIRSGTVFGNVQLRSTTLTWLCHIAQNSGGHSNTASLRGGVISVFTLIVKRFPKESAQFVGIGESLRFSFEDAARGLAAPDLTASNLISSPCAMLLNRTVEVLTMAGDAKLSWLQPVGSSSCVEAVAQILQYFSALHLDRESPLTAPLNQLQIKVCKAFSMVVEIHMTVTTPSSRRIDDLSGVAIAEAPSNVLKLISSTSIIHDIFQSTYQSSLDMTNAASQWTIHRAALLINAIGEALSSQNQSKTVADSSAVEEDAGSEGEKLVVVTYPYPSVIEIRRVESLLGLLCCVLDCHQDCKQAEGVTSLTQDKDKDEDEDKDGDKDKDGDESRAVADTVVALIQDTMSNLKLSLSREALSSATCGGTQKDLRAASSDARKGCIAVAHSLLTALPEWVAHDLHTQESVSSSRCWLLAVKLLSTPLLFGAAYGASASSLTEGGDANLHQHKHQLFTEHILQYISTALKNISKYSYPVACDVLTALEELMDKHCVAILHFQQDIPLLLLEAYLSMPKGIATSGKMKKAVAGSDDGNAYEWKLHVMSTLKSVFQFATRVHIGSGFSTTFVNRFVEEVCCSELFILHGALGNMLPGHVAFLASLLAPPEEQEEEGEGGGAVCRTTALLKWHSSCQAAGFSVLTPISSTDSNTKSLSKKEKCRKDCNRLVTKMLGSSEMSEPLVGLLHTVTLSLVSFMDVVNMTLRSRTEKVSIELGATSSQSLLVLVCFIKDISGRQLLFEDDGAQLCGELDVLSRYLEMTLLLLQGQSPSSVEQQQQQALVRQVLEVFIHTCYRATMSSFQLGASFGRIIYEMSYNELLKTVGCVLALRAGGDSSDEEVALVVGDEVSPTFELAVRGAASSQPRVLNEEGGGARAAEASDRIMQRLAKRREHLH